MSEHNVELHRRAIEAFNSRDPEALIVYMHPNVEYHPVLAGISGVTVYRGHEGVRSWLADFEDVFGDELRVEPEAYFALGEHTLLVYVLRGRGRRSGAEVTMKFAQVIRWHDDLGVYCKVYADRAEAFADLGVSEDALRPIAP